MLISFASVSLLAVLSPAFQEAASASLPSPIEAGALFADAVRKQRSGDLAGAVADYRRLLEVQPQNVEVRSNLGAALAGQGRYAEAIDEYRAALTQDPAQAAVRLNLAVALQKAGRPTDAAPELERVLSQEPGDRRATILLAESRAQLGEYGKAAFLLTPLYDKDPTDRAVTYLLGLALVQNKQTDRGKVLLDAVLRNGESGEALLLLGAVKHAVGEYAAARDDFARAASLNPNLPSVNGWLGKAHMNVGETEKAAEAFRKELATNPNHYDSNLLLGVLLKQGQKPSEAMERFQKAASLRPGAPEALYQLGSLHLSMGDTENARSALETVVAGAPDFLEAHVSLATVYYRLKRKADGDRHRSIAEELRHKLQEQEPGAQAVGDVYRGEPAGGRPGQTEKPTP
jgi:tetratricopeptide (TPR) repeat protein